MYVYLFLYRSRDVNFFSHLLKSQCMFSFVKFGISLNRFWIVFIILVNIFTNTHDQFSVKNKENIICQMQIFHLFDTVNQMIHKINYNYLLPILSSGNDEIKSCTLFAMVLMQSRFFLNQKN